MLGRDAPRQVPPPTATPGSGPRTPAVADDHCCYLVMELGAFTLSDYLHERRALEDGGMSMKEVYEIFLALANIVHGGGINGLTRFLPCQ